MHSVHFQGDLMSLMALRPFAHHSKRKQRAKKPQGGGEDEAGKSHIPFQRFDPWGVEQTLELRPTVLPNGIIVLFA